MYAMCMCACMRVHVRACMHTGMLERAKVNETRKLMGLRIWKG